MKTDSVSMDFIFIFAQIPHKIIAGFGDFFVNRLTVRISALLNMPIAKHFAASFLLYNPLSRSLLFFSFSQENTARIDTDNTGY